MRQARRSPVIAACLGVLGLLVATQAASACTLPEGFVDVLELDPSIQLELRYLGEDNFVGAPVDGYGARCLVLSQRAGEALAAVQQDLARFGLGLRVYDAYRPQRAVDHFVRWARDLDDRKTKERFYPAVPKSELFQRGYIAERSGHTRGSTVDLTLVPLDAAPDDPPLDMGSPWDFFGPVSWPPDRTITPQQRANRMLLQSVMIRHGFQPYDKEWWHFTLADEPYPETYFDFPIAGPRE